MSNFIKQVVVNSDYIKRLLQSQEMMDVLLSEGEKWAPLKRLLWVSTDAT